MATRIKTTVYLDPDVHAGLAQHAQRRGQTPNHAAQTLLTRALRPEESEEAMADYIAALDRLRFQVAELRRVVVRNDRLLGETLSLFVRLFLTHHPELPPAAREAAVQAADARHERFLELVAERIAARTGPEPPLPVAAEFTAADFRADGAGEGGHAG